MLYIGQGCNPARANAGRPCTASVLQRLSSVTLIIVLPAGVYGVSVGVDQIGLYGTRYDRRTTPSASLWVFLGRLRPESTGEFARTSWRHDKQVFEHTQSRGWWKDHVVCCPSLAMLSCKCGGMQTPDNQICRPVAVVLVSRAWRGCIKPAAAMLPAA
jgi:hypothetical protein